MLLVVPVEFLWTIPISAAELAFKKAKGTGALLDLFDQRELPWLFEPHRTSYLR
jgi:Suppressor of fused protein (SUFU)